MNNLFAITILVISIILAGYPYVLRITQHRTERLSLAFILGSGLLTFVWFAISQLGYPLTLPTYCVSVLAVFSLGLLIPRVTPPVPPKVSPKLSLLDNLLKISIWVIAGLAVLVSIYSPVISWDSLTLYDFRGIVIAQSGSLSDIELSTYHLSYPLMTSLIHALVYLLGGNNPQVFYSLTYLAILGMVYGRMIVWTDRTYALLASLLVAINPMMWKHATISYTNLPYAVFMLTGLLIAPSSLIISGTLIGLSTWSRSSEPFWLVGLIMILYLAWKQKKYIQGVIGIGVTLMIRYTWLFYQTAAFLRVGYTPDSSNSVYNAELFSKIMHNLDSIGSYVNQHIFMPYLSTFLLSLISAIGAIYIYRKSGKCHYPLVLLVIFYLFIGMAIGGTAVFSTYYSSWYSIGGSATRMLLFIVPLAPIVGLYIHYVIRKK